MIIRKLHLTNSWPRLETNIPRVVNGMQEVVTRAVVGKSACLVSQQSEVMKADIEFGQMGRPIPTSHGHTLPPSHIWGPRNMSSTSSTPTTPAWQSKGPARPRLILHFLLLCWWAYVGSAPSPGFAGCDFTTE